VINKLTYFETGIKNNFHLLKGKLLKFYLTIHGCKIGKGLKCKKWPLFRCFPQSNIIIGDNVTIGYNITFDILKSGILVLSDFVNLTQNIIISSNKEIKIGRYSLIAENVSIRDSDHDINGNKKIALQGVNYSSINIGNDVWIGAGCIVLKGSKIPAGVVIGANSVVTGNQHMEVAGIYAGAPGKLVKKRDYQ
jgi:acetyltransferase-like isoleucine patch superfamily enzyme